MNIIQGSRVRCKLHAVTDSIIHFARYPPHSPHRYYHSPVNGHTVPLRCNCRFQRTSQLITSSWRILASLNPKKRYTTRGEDNFHTNVVRVRIPTVTDDMALDNARWGMHHGQLHGHLRRLARCSGAVAPAQLTALHFLRIWPAEPVRGAMLPILTMASPKSQRKRWLL